MPDQLKQRKYQSPQAGEVDGYDRLRMVNGFSRVVSNYPLRSTMSAVAVGI
jgi:hypothetical protein